MEDVKITVESFLDSRELREQAIGRIEVLEKVKQLFLIPELECMTVNQVADYFEVDAATIKKQYQRNQDEFDSDGTCLKMPYDFKFTKETLCPFRKIEQLRTALIVTLDDNTELIIPNRGIRCFPKRAILRMGMLLRDSPIAKEIRTQLLNVFEHSTPEQRTSSINEEEILVGNIVRAALKSDMTTTITSLTEYIGYKNRYIAKIEEHNKALETANAALAKKEQTWELKPILVALIRTLAAKCYNSKYGVAWKDFYKQFKYKYHIDVDARWRNNNEIGRKIDYINKDELQYATSLAVSFCHAANIDTGKIINEVNNQAVKAIDMASTKK